LQYGTHFPGQINESDCGVFSCLYADFISTQMTEDEYQFPFTHADINDQRYRIAYSLLHDKEYLLDDFSTSG
jgi:Ulp1 family protease